MTAGQVTPISQIAAQALDIFRRGRAVTVNEIEQFLGYGPADTVSALLELRRLGLIEKTGERDHDGRRLWGLVKDA
jgi:DNA-binding IclR family transcriptional regulator